MVSSYSFYSSYSTQYKAVIDKAISLGYQLPSVNQQRFQDQLMRTWITDGIFAKADLLYMMANDAGLNFARINWKNPNSNLLTDVGIVNYMRNQGPWTDSASLVAGALNTGWAPSSGVNFTLDSNCAIVSLLGGYAACGVFYSAGGGTTDFVQHYSLDFLRGVYSNSNAGLAGGALHNNFSSMNKRTASNAVQLPYVYEGVASVILTGAQVSTIRPAQPLYLLSEPIGGVGLFNTGSPLNAFFIGAVITDPEFVSYDTALRAYLNKLRYSEMLFITINTPVNYTVPAGITELYVECWGGGGAGRGFNTGTALKTGAGGAGGGYSASLLSVTPGQIIPYVIGGGGVGTLSVGPPGLDTYWNGGQVLAKGGAGGGNVDFDHANGGAASAGVGQVKFTGGGGGAQGTVLNASTGSGGSAASPLGDGVNGYDGVVASALYTRTNYNSLGPGPPGPSQPNNANAAGTLGMLASGGGGARRVSGTRGGGGGAQGFIRVSAIKQY